MKVWRDLKWPSNRYNCLQARSVRYPPVRYLLEEEDTVMRRRDPSVYARDDIAWALYEWRTAWGAVHESPNADEYIAGIEVLLGYLEKRDTFADLLAAFSGPDVPLLALTHIVCADPSTQLEPYLLMAAACHLRLRALVMERCSTC